MEKKRQNKSIIIAVRSAIVTAVVLLCITAVFLGICKSYEGIKKVSTGESITAVYICEDYIRILDLKIPLFVH